MQIKDIIYAGYRIAGILTEAQRGYSPSEETDGLLTLNSMVKSWKADRCMVFAIARTLFTLQPNKASYTIAASGADIVLDRPDRLEGAGLVFATTHVETPLRVFYEQEWRALPNKTDTG